MSLITTLDITHPELALTPTIRSSDVEEIRVIPQSATDPETGKFFFLVKGLTEGFEETLDSDPTVCEWTCVADAENSRVYRMRHPDEAKLISPETIELGGLMLEASSTDLGWTVRLQLPDREALAELWEFCEAEDIAFKLKRMYRQEGWGDGESGELTAEQNDALVAAYEHGYFEEPREASLADLAEKLDISPTAVGGRIRRGTAELVKTTLLDE